MIYWILQATGTNNGFNIVSTRWYNFWSGFGGLLERLIELLVIGLLIYWHHTCHIPFCLRPGRHPFQHYKLCAKHHPDTPSKITLSHILKLHKEQNEKA